MLIVVTSLVAFASPPRYVVNHVAVLAPDHDDSPYCTRIGTVRTDTPEEIDELLPVCTDDPHVVAYLTEPEELLNGKYQSRLKLCVFYTVVPPVAGTCYMDRPDGTTWFDWDYWVWSSWE